MGFLPGHTRRSHKDYKHGVRQPDAFAEDSVRCSLLGNSVHTGAFSVLIGNLFTAAGFPQVEVSPDERKYKALLAKASASSKQANIMSVQGLLIMFTYMMASFLRDQQPKRR